MASWLIYDEKDDVFGVKTSKVISFNDGDVALATVTQELLPGCTNPVCVDIGADIGWWSSFCLDSSPSATVCAFEPNPHSFERLVTTFQSEPRITVFPKAISNTDSTIPLSFEGPLSNSRDPTIESVVATTRPDFLFEKFERISMIKIDTEGHEPKILEALSYFFPKIDSLVFEFTPKWYGETTSQQMNASMKLCEIIYAAYKHIYMLNRRGPAELVAIPTPDDFITNTRRNLNLNIQVDILCSNTEITQTKIVPFETFVI